MPLYQWEIPDSRNCRCVNALGDIFSPQNGQKIAGLKTRDRSGFLDSVHELYRFMTPRDQFYRANTTIGAVITNGAFSKAELNKIASMTAVPARCINPVATMTASSIYAASIGDVSVDINMAGTLAAEVMAQAIKNAIHTSGSRMKNF